MVVVVVVVVVVYHSFPDLLMLRVFCNPRNAAFELGVARGPNPIDVRRGHALSKI
jgi:hypothetical protein